MPRPMRLNEAPDTCGLSIPSIASSKSTVLPAPVGALTTYRARSNNCDNTVRWTEHQTRCWLNVPRC
eukprot:6480400-Amphidinium_carterae.2